MSISQFLHQATIWLAWSALGLGLITLIAFLTRWGAKFRLVGATIFTLLLSGSCWAFAESYTPPFVVEGAIYAPVVYDNGYDLVIAQAPDGFPEDATEPSLLQIAGNLKGGGRNGAKVHVKIRKQVPVRSGVSHPIILGEAIRDINKSTTILVEAKENPIENDISIEIQDETIN
ncbi:Ycf51 family protein [Prochlorococcus marinus]|uniref:Uncharacterized protein n=1 Tax=Prochlorococcus marinus (strain MIT 9211) TaxID=93059 RepID=A9BAY2_PROM4|nr:Ycf51 family protein [Prochlorococcus marinus]ABX08994.1 conserved hypothetical protein [Prochlorococcus marinus str. MIT 9211]